MPKIKSPIKDIMERTYKILEYFIKKLMERIWMNKKIKTEIIAKNNCFVNGLKEKIESNK